METREYFEKIMQDYRSTLSLGQSKNQNRNGRSLCKYCKDEAVGYNWLMEFKKTYSASRPQVQQPVQSLHYSSEEGVEMAMTYLTIIETAKMWGLQVKEYLTYVWREVMGGRSTSSLGLSKNTDYESMTPEMVIAKQNS